MTNSLESVLAAAITYLEIKREPKNPLVKSFGTTLEEEDALELLQEAVDNALEELSEKGTLDPTDTP